MAVVFMACGTWVSAGIFGFREPEAQAGSLSDAQFAAMVANSTVFAPANDSPLSDGSVQGVAQETRGNAQKVSASWAETASAKTGIPIRAVVGYAGATLAINASNPTCHMNWFTIAAIGNVESGHGTHGSSRINEYGVTQPSIYGPLLDGVEYPSTINDTDNGRFDGNRLFDRAVGPMQFIPSTWARWGVDGNGDGRKDPQQIDDAALATASYLCHYGDLSDLEGWRRAIFGYNHLDSYVNSIANMVKTYADRMG